MKKILAALAACTLVLSFAACSSSSDNTGGNYGNYGGNTGGNTAGNTGGNTAGNTGGNAGGNTTGNTPNNTGTAQTPSTPAAVTPAEETKVSNKAYKMGETEGVYTGDWKDGAPNGNGTFVVEGKIKVSGEWLNGKLNGQGQITDASGKMTSGSFLNNKLNGIGHIEGTLSDGTKATFDGTYNNGTFVSGKKIYKTTNGQIQTYDGNWDSNGYLSSGSKTVEYADGSLIYYDGKFTNGEITSGIEVVKNADGSITGVDGTWNSEGKFYNGTYEIYNSDGSVKETGTVTNGKWVDDTTKLINNIAGDLITDYGKDIEDDHPIIGWFLGEVGEAVKN